MPKWGKPQQLNEEARRFILLTREGFLEGDWSFTAQKTPSNCYFTNPLRTSRLEGACSALSINDRCNIYITANAFSSNKGHKAQFLFGMHNLVADIDCHSSTLDASARNQQIENLVHAVKHAQSDYALLEPSFIVRTGRGVQFWWHHEGLSVKSNLWTWESVARRIRICMETIMRDLGNDPVDGCPNLRLDLQASFNPAGLYRLPGTINQATGTMVHFEQCHPHTYSLAELKEFRDEVPITAKPFVPQKPSDTRAWGIQMFRKVSALREFRDADEGEELRNNFCFTVYCLLRTAGYEEGEARKETEEFNRGFRCPLRESELRSSLSAAVHKSYKLSTKAIIDLLQITKVEQKTLGIGYNLKKLQRAERVKFQAKQREKRNKGILELYRSGYAKAAIARQLGISIPTIAKVVRAAQEESPKAKRDACIIRMYHDGMEGPQIASAAGCSLRTVWRVIAKAKQEPAAESLAVAECSNACDCPASSFYAMPCQNENEKLHNGCLSPGRVVSGGRSPYPLPALLSGPTGSVRLLVAQPMGLGGRSGWMGGGIP